MTAAREAAQAAARNEMRRALVFASLRWSLDEIARELKVCRNTAWALVGTGRLVERFPGLEDMILGFGYARLASSGLLSELEAAEDATEAAQVIRDHAHLTKVQLKERLAARRRRERRREPRRENRDDPARPRGSGDATRGLERMAAYAALRRAGLESQVRVEEREVELGDGSRATVPVTVCPAARADGGAMPVGFNGPRGRRGTR